MTDTDTNELQIEMIHEGKPTIISGSILKQCDEIALVVLEMGGEFYDIYQAYGNEMIVSPYINPRADNMTIVRFPQFAGWSIWTIRVNDENIRICLTRGDK